MYLRSHDDMGVARKSLGRYREVCNIEPRNQLIDCRMRLSVYCEPASDVAF